MQEIHPDEAVRRLSAHHNRTRIKLEEMLENNDVARQLTMMAMNSVMMEKEKMVKKLKEAHAYIQKLQEHCKAHNLEVPPMEESKTENPAEQT